MSLENMIVTLKKMRFLEHEDDNIEVFEETLNEIAQTLKFINLVVGLVAGRVSIHKEA